MVGGGGDPVARGHGGWVMTSWLERPCTEKPRGRRWTGRERSLKQGMIPKTRQNPPREEVPTEIEASQPSDPTKNRRDIAGEAVVLEINKLEGAHGGEEGGTGEAQRGEGLGEFPGDKAGLTNAGEEDIAWGIEKGLGESQCLPEVQLVEEVIQVPLLRLEEMPDPVSA